MNNQWRQWPLVVRHWSQELRSSFWFLPGMIVAGAVMLAAIIISIDANAKLSFVEDWPLLFGAGADGARGLLSAVASSMITVAGVVFSITIVALSLTSSQYTSRVLRNFMRDRINQMVLGVFVGIFAYCLVVLRTIRGGDEGAFVPSLAVMIGLVLAFVGIAFLIYFIHHIALSIQAASIIAAVAAETMAAVEHIFPDRLGHSAESAEVGDKSRDEAKQWVTVHSQSTGYIESVDADALLSLAEELNCIVKMEQGIGEFTIKGTPLVSLADVSHVELDTIDAINALYVVSRQRTVQQDAAFGIRQIADVALKALSPGINDTTTAVMCTEYLAAILVQLASRDIPSPYRYKDGQLRVIARVSSFESLLAESLDQIRQNAQGNVAVLKRQAELLETICRATDSIERRSCLRRQAELIAIVADSTVAPHDVGPIKVAVNRLINDPCHWHSQSAS